MQKISAHVVDLPFDGVACHSAFSPPLRDHGAEPDIADREQNGRCGLARSERPRSDRIKRLTVHGKVLGPGHNDTRQRCLKLGACLKPLH